MTTYFNPSKIIIFTYKLDPFTVYLIKHTHPCTDSMGSRTGPPWNRKGSQVGIRAAKDKAVMAPRSRLGKYKK